MLLARVAENLYWMGRYLERAENLARLINVNSHLLLDLPKGIAPGWRPLIEITGNMALYSERQSEFDEVRVLLRFKDQPLADCGEVNSLLDEHIGHVAERIKALRALEKELRTLRAACTVPHAAADCGILQGIDHAGAKPSAASKRHVRGAH